MQLLKDTYNQALTNFSKYSLKTENKNSPKQDFGYIVLFKKEQDFYYGIIEDIHADQVKIICNQTEYVRPYHQVVHISNARNSCLTNYLTVINSSV